MIQQKKSTTKTPWDPRPYTVTQVKGSQVEVKRGEEVKRRALNLIKKLKYRREGENRETKSRDDEDPDIDITIEEVRRRIREEKEAAAGGAQENSILEESTDSDFTITYEGVLGSPEQASEEVRLNGDTSEDSVSLGRSSDEEKASGGKAPRLSPKQRHRRQSLARFKKKQWGEDWIV